MKTSPLLSCVGLRGLWKILLLAWLVLWQGLGVARAQNALVFNGQAYAQIVISPTASRMAVLAATELQTYIEKMTGVELAIVTQPNPVMVKVYVGESSYTAYEGIDVSGLNDGAFRMVSGYNWLALVGRDHDFTPVEPYGHNRSTAEQNRVRQEWDLITGETYISPFYAIGMYYFPEQDVWEYDGAGTLNAVHEFLRSLGVRWYAPGEIGEVVPETNVVMLPLVDETVVPDFPVRDFKIYYAHEGLADLGPWKLRLGATPGARFIGSTQPGHGSKFVIMRPEFKVAHPEAYALKADGTRETEHNGDGIPCLSSSVFFEKHVKYVREIMDHYGEQVVSIDMPDGFGSRACLCTDCVAQYTPERGPNGKLSNYVWNYMNDVAAEIAISHPGRKVSGLAYSAYQLPPENLSLNANLMVIECRWRSNFYNSDTKQYYKDLRTAWLNVLPTDEYAIWDYYLHSRPNSAAIPAVFPHLIAADLLDLRGKSRGDTIEVYNTQNPAATGYAAFALNHLNMYVTSRLWWDAELDVDALLEEYYTLYYGPASVQMKAFLEYCEDHWMEMKTNGAAIGEALTRLTAARNAATTGTVYAQRIEKIAERYEGPMQTLQQSLVRYTEDLPSYRVMRGNIDTENSMSENPLNGIIEPDYWAGSRTGVLTTMPGYGYPPGCTFQIVSENNALYVALNCTETNMAGMTIPTTTSGDPAILDGDYVSIIFETPTHSYYEIVINPAGAVLEIDHATGGSPNWVSGVQAAVHQDAGKWTVEMRIPIMGEGAAAIDPDLGIDGNIPRTIAPWYFNVARQRVQAGVVTRKIFYRGSPVTYRSPVNLAHMYVK